MIVPLARKSVIAGIFTMNPPRTKALVLGGFFYAHSMVSAHDPVTMAVFVALGGKPDLRDTASASQVLARCLFCRGQAGWEPRWISRREFDFERMFTTMKTVRLEDATLDRCVNEAQQERVMLTRDGHPVALVAGVNGMDEEQVQLSSSPEFWKLIEESRSQKTIRREELERRLSSD
jgi:hypothetical protein